MTTQLPNATDYYLSEEFEYLKNQLSSAQASLDNEIIKMHVNSNAAINIAGTTVNTLSSVSVTTIASSSNTISVLNTSATDPITITNNDTTNAYKLIIRVVFKCLNNLTGIPVSLQFKDFNTNADLTDWIVSYNITSKNDKQVVGYYEFVTDLSAGGTITMIGSFKSPKPVDANVSLNMEIYAIRQ